MMASVIVLLLLLMSFITYAEGNISIIHDQCRRNICFQLWALDGVRMALLTNGQIQSAAPEAEGTKCSLPTNTLTHPNPQLQCRRDPCFSEDQCAFVFSLSRFINTTPGRSVSLQCALLSSVTTSSCFEPLLGLVVAKWVDENGNVVEEGEGEEYSVTRKSACDVTLTVSFQSPKNASFRCLAGANDRAWTSERIGVRLRAPKGRGLMPRERAQPEVDGGSAVTDRDPVVGPTVGVLSALLVVAAALYVLNKRRANSRASEESPTSTANCVDLDSDEVVYADVVFLSNRAPVSVSADEVTVYATVRCTS